MASSDFLGALSLRDLERFLDRERGDIRTRLAHGLETNIEPWEEERVSDIDAALRNAAEAAARSSEFGLYLVEAGASSSKGVVSSGIVSCNSETVALGMMMIAKPQGRYLRWISADVTFLTPWRDEFSFLFLSPWGA